jgi:Pentapeptide repeats (8 copies)
MQHVDLTSPEMTAAEMTRAEVEAVIAAATSTQPADFTGKKLSGLDLSGLDLSGAVLRAVRLNRTKLEADATTRGCVSGIDQASIYFVEARLPRSGRPVRQPISETAATVSAFLARRAHAIRSNSSCDFQCPTKRSSTGSSFRASCRPGPTPRP